MDGPQRHCEIGNECLRLPRLDGEQSAGVEVGSKAAQERQSEPRHNLLGGLTIARVPIAGTGHSMRIASSRLHSSPTGEEFFTLTSTVRSRPVPYKKRRNESADRVEAEEARIAPEQKANRRLGRGRAGAYRPGHGSAARGPGPGRDRDDMQTRKDGPVSRGLPERRDLPFEADEGPWRHETMHRGTRPLPCPVQGSLVSAWNRSAGARHPIRYKSDSSFEGKSHEWNRPDSRYPRQLAQGVVQSRSAARGTGRSPDGRDPRDLRPRRNPSVQRGRRADTSDSGRRAEGEGS